MTTTNTTATIRLLFFDQVQRGTLAAGAASVMTGIAIVGAVVTAAVASSGAVAAAAGASAAGASAGAGATGAAAAAAGSGAGTGAVVEEASAGGMGALVSILSVGWFPLELPLRCFGIVHLIHSEICEWINFAVGKKGQLFY